MEWLNKPRAWVVLGVAALGLFLLYQLWVWEVERVEVPPDHFLVKVHLWGKDLPEGEIVAPDESYRGVQRRLLKEGRWFLNPILYAYEKHKVLEVPNDSCAVLIRKAGPPIPPDRLARGEFLAEGAFDPEGGEVSGERGILRDVLRPSKYYINPHEYAYELHRAVKIEANQVGVRVLKWGKDPRQLNAAERAAAGPYVVPAGYRGVQKEFVPSGTYYINPYVEAIIPVDIRSHEVAFADIVFPSRDGFQIQPHVKVTYRVIDRRAPELFVKLCDQGKLEQGDSTAAEQKRNPILQKVVLPMIRGVVRVEGSMYDARDYVSQQGGDWPWSSVNPRVELQDALTRPERLEHWARNGVLIESIAVGKLTPNSELQKLADQIAVRETTRAEQATNRRLVEQYEQEQDLRAKEALSPRKDKVVAANEKLKVEMTRADQNKQTETAKLKNELKSAQARLAAAREQAKAIITRGKAEASVTMARNEAEVAGLRTAIGGFPSADHFAQYHVLTRLSPALSEIFASDTSEFAKVFSTYMTPAARRNGAATTKKPE